jgi:hypothetical protein
MPRNCRTSSLLAACCAVALCSITQATATPSNAEGSSLLVVDQKVGPPSCGVFFDRWEIAGVPKGMTAKVGFGRELVAAADCVEKNNVSMACEHWRRLLVVADKMGPPLSGSRGAIEGEMRRRRC